MALKGMKGKNKTKQNKKKLLNTSTYLLHSQIPSSDSLSWDKDAIGACISPRGTPRSEGRGQPALGVTQVRVCLYVIKTLAGGKCGLRPACAARADPRPGHQQRGTATLWTPAARPGAAARRRRGRLRSGGASLPRREGVVERGIDLHLKR